MAVRVAINGFGRVGRAAFRAAHERDADLEFVAINDVADGVPLAHLLRTTPSTGRSPETIERGDVHRRRRVWSAVFQEARPADLPWAELGVEVVLECTGQLRTRAEAAGHLDAGAER